MKQAELAKLLSVKPQSVSRYEKEVNDLDTDTIKRLCEIFDVSADYLLGISSFRKMQYTAADAALVAAYHAADDDRRLIVDTALGLRRAAPDGEAKKGAVS